MRHVVARAIVCLIAGSAVAMFAGCDRPSGKGAVVEGSNAPAVAAPVPSPSDTSCPATGLWARCSVFYRLERAGLAVRRELAKDVQEKPLTITGIELPIARGDIRIFLYADSASRARDQARLDMTQFVFPVQQPGFKRERTIAQSVNLLVLMNVLNETNRERIANSLMAGAPQPPRKSP